MKNLSFDDLCSARADFWADHPNAMQRRKKMRAAIECARKNYLLQASVEAMNPEEYANQMVFYCGAREVCERAFCNIIGVASRQGFKSRVWNSIVEAVISKLTK